MYLQASQANITLFPIRQIEKVIFSVNMCMTDHLIKPMSTKVIPLRYQQHKKFWKKITAYWKFQLYAILGQRVRKLQSMVKKMSEIKLKKGDNVVMHTCLESKGKNLGKVWTCHTDSFKCEAGIEVVFLEGFSGFFYTKFLQPVKLDSFVKEKLNKAENIIRDLYFIIQGRIDYENNIQIKDSMDLAKDFLNEVK